MFLIKSQIFILDIMELISDDDGANDQGNGNRKLDNDQDASQRAFPGTSAAAGF